MAYPKFELPTKIKEFQDIYADKLSNEIRKFENLSKSDNIQKSFLDKNKDITDKYYRGGEEIGRCVLDIGDAKTVNPIFITAFENKRLKDILPIGTIISCVHEKIGNKTIVTIYIYLKNNKSINKFEFINKNQTCIIYEVIPYEKNNKFKSQSQSFIRSEQTNSSFEQTNSSSEQTNSSSEQTNSSFEQTNSSSEKEHSVSEKAPSNFETVRPYSPITIKMNIDFKIIDTAIEKLENNKNKLIELYTKKRIIDNEIKKIEEEIKQFTGNNTNQKISIISHRKIEDDSMKRDIVSTSPVAEVQEDKIVSSKKLIKSSDTTYATALKLNLGI